MSETFKKNIEDFTCEHCGLFVVGNGYTNHCPDCLYSKHVDENPGDRKSECGGNMKPIRVEGTEKEYVITHKCESCGHEKRNKASKEDSIDALAIVAKKSADLKN